MKGNHNKLNNKSNKYYVREEHEIHEVASRGVMEAGIFDDIDLTV